MGDRAAGLVKTQTLSGIFALFLLCAPAARAAAPSTVLTDNQGISAFELYGNGLYWWSSHGVCGTEFPHNATIQIRGTFGSSTKALEKDCTILQGQFDNAVRDDAYAYFFSNRQLMRKALNAQLSDPPQVLVTSNYNPTLPVGQPGAVLAVSNGKLYWSRYNNGLSDLFSMPVDGSEAPHYFLTITGGAEVQKMQFVRFTEGSFTLDGLIVLLGNGKLYRYKFNRTGTLNQIASGISDFAVHHSFSLFGIVTATVYAAEGQAGVVSPNVAPGRLFKIDGSDGTSSVIFTAQGNNQLLGVATDSDSFLTLGNAPTKNIYIAEAVVTCGQLFCVAGDIVIRRHTLPGAASGWDQIVSTGGGYNLRSDDDFLYFTLNDTIKKISTDAPAQVLDLKADAVEVVQAIQDLNSSIPLVANRPTYVRAYAHLASNTTGKSPWFPPAKLRGFNNGVELPGSPIEPINSPMVDSTNDLGVLRSDNTHCFLFELPSEWVKARNPVVNLLTFEFTVNHNLDVPETGANPLSNNKATSAAASLVEKGWPCVVTIQVYTTGPLYYTDNPNFAPNMERARSLLPIEDLSIFNFAADEPVGDPDEPFDMLDPNSDNRSDTADDILDAVDDVDLDSDPCDDKDDVHYLGLMHKDSVKVPGVIGDSYRDDVSCWITMFDGSVSGHGPGGGEDLAHEFGHNYGRRHIQCGSFPADQADFDFVPFPATLGSPTREGAGSPFGFDPITLTVIPPDTACDTMSYGSQKWDSIWYWTALIGKTAPALALQSLETRSALAAPGGPVALISGNIDVANNLAVLRPFKILPGAAAPAKKLARSRRESAEAGGDLNPYKLRFLDDQGAVLSEVTIKAKETSNHNEKRGERLHFGQYVDFPPGARTFRFVHADGIVAERFISAHAPVLTLDRPVIDAAAQTLALSWTASDPDGDDLRFTVQYSSDNGAHWMSLKSNWKPMGMLVSTRLLSGGTQCRLRVTATDGANTAMAVTDPFAIGTHAPEPQIQGVLESEQIPFGSTRMLRGSARDAETPGERLRLTWNIAGPTSLQSTGTVVSLREFSPGLYQATLTATDPDGQAAAALRHFEILPLVIPDGSAPTLDGLVNDPAYATAAFVRMPLGNGQFSNVKLVHADGNLFVSFNNLQLPTGRASSRRVGLRVDANASADALGKAGDAGFFVDSEGIPSQEMGTGNGMAVTLSPKPGFTAVIFQGSTTWSTELRIADELIGGWNHLAGIMLDHDTPHWPVNASDQSPATWASVFFGAALPTAKNQAPVAKAGSDQRIAIRFPRNVYLDGTSSYDLDGDPLRFSWKQLSGPAVALAGADSALPSFLAPLVTAPTALNFELTVSDAASSNTDQVQVTLLPAIQLPPPASREGFATLQSNGELKIRLIGSPKQRYRLEMSEDLRAWATVRRVDADFSGRIDISQLVDFAGRPHLFFRAVSP